MSAWPPTCPCAWKTPSNCSSLSGKLAVLHLKCSVLYVLYTNKVYKGLNALFMHVAPSESIDDLLRRSQQIQPASLLFKHPGDIVHANAPCLSVRFKSRVHGRFAPAAVSGQPILLYHRSRCLSQHSPERSSSKWNTFHHRKLELCNGSYALLGGNTYTVEPTTLARPRCFACDIFSFAGVWWSGKPPLLLFSHPRSMVRASYNEQGLIVLRYSSRPWRD